MKEHCADYSLAKYAESRNDALTARDTRITGEPNHGWSFEQSEILMRERLVRVGTPCCHRMEVKGGGNAHSKSVAV